MPAGFHSALQQLANLQLSPEEVEVGLISMDSIFLVGEGERAAFFQQMIQSYGCVYVCLWSYLPQPSSCLLALDGLYREQNDQPTSSSGSLARQLFDAYRESVNYVDSGRAPGLAFKNNIPYMELNLHDLQRLASNQVQLQFYQAARIKTVAFMGCATGEIELGVSNDPQVNLEVEMRNIFPMDFSRRRSISISGSLPPHSDPNQPPSSSSSSLRSLSAESPLLFNTTINPTTTSFPQDQSAAFKEPLLAEAIFRPVIPSSSSTSPRQALNQIRNMTHLPTIESEDAAMTKAILAVLSSPSSSSCTSHQNCIDNTAQNSASVNPTAFRRYLPPSSHAAALRRPRNSNMFKRAVSYFRNLNVVRRNEESHHHVQENRPSTTQLHHVISERRRREKLNESFQVLRSLLPPGTKKDKASVLSSTTDYLSSLKSQVEELGRRNQMLESRISVQKPTNVDQLTVASSSMERINVEITQVSSSTSEARFLDLRVTVRGEGISMLDLVIGLLEFLKQQSNVTLLSIESNTRMLESVPVHGIMMRLKIEGDEFDESGFQEAVRKVVGDQAGN